MLTLTHFYLSLTQFLNFNAIGFCPNTNLHLKLKRYFANTSCSSRVFFNQISTLSLQTCFSSTDMKRMQKAWSTCSWDGGRGCSV